MIPFLIKTEAMEISVWCMNAWHAYAGVLWVGVRVAGVLYAGFYNFVGGVLWVGVGVAGRLCAGFHFFVPGIGQKIVCHKILGDFCVRS